MKKLLLISTLLLIVSCSTTKEPPQIVYQTVEVEVPIYTAPEFDIPEKPSLAIDNLTWSEFKDHEAIGKAYVKTVHTLESYTNQLLNLLEGIRSDNPE